MGKNKTDASGAVKSLFADDNPFRRAVPPAAAHSPPPPPDRAPDLARIPTPKRTIPRPSPDSSPKKSKKLDHEREPSEGSEKKRRKRKRDEIEAEYEKRKLGPAAAAEEDEGGLKRSVVAVGTKRKAADVDVAPTQEEEEAFDDESKLLRTVFVGNLPLKTKRKALVKEFAQFGEVESVRIRSVPITDSKIPRKGAIMKGKINDTVDSVHAYIVFKDEKSAQASLSHNMAEVGGNHIRVDMACPPRKKMRGEAPLYDRKRTVFMGNLPFDVKDEEIYQLLCGSTPSESTVEAVRVIRDPHTSLGKGIAYVLFKTRDAANAVVRKRDLKIRDRTLRLSHAKSDTMLPSKRKDSGPKRDFPHKRVAVTSGDTSAERREKPKVKAASLSYQGLRASKSGVLKKAGLRTHSNGHASNERKRAEGSDQKVRKTKRPAVAARKAKLLKKRKQESGTPENTHRYKKARR